MNILPFFFTIFILKIEKVKNFDGQIFVTFDLHQLKLTLFNQLASNILK